MNKPKSLIWKFSDSQLYILLVGATLTSVVVLFSYYQQKKKENTSMFSYLINCLSLSFIQKREWLKCKSLSDFEQLAKKLMMKHRFYYYDFKAGQGHTYQACRDYYDKQLRIMPRVLSDVTNVSLKTTIFG